MCAKNISWGVKAAGA